MMKKVWKNRKGVSPVIATILMVAITVVLAAVLYVMVMGFNNPANNTPTGTLTYAKSGATYTVTLQSISKNDVTRTDTKFLITPLAAGVVRSDSGNTAAGGKNLTGATGTFCTAGDYALLALPAGSYTVSVLYVPSGNNIASTTIVVAA
jgi:flagellin-like protein